MFAVCPERRKGNEIIGFVGHAAAALSCSLLFRGTSGNPAGALDASKMTVLSSRLDQVTPRVLPRKRSGLFAALLTAMAALSLGGCADTFTQVYQRGYIPPEGALEQVPLGASQEQVLIVLGTPSTVATVSGEVFYYISQRAEQKLAFMTQDVTNQRVIAVYFDKNRRVAAAGQLRAQGRQGVRLRQPHHADHRRRAELHQLHLRHHQAARQ